MVCFFLQIQIFTWTLIMLTFMGIQMSIMFALFTIDSGYFGPNAELVVLVCSQCSTSRHSACLWRCISHPVFGIQPVDSLMSSWHAECHQTLAAKTKVIWPFPVSKSAVHNVRGSERAHRCEWVLRWVPVRLWAWAWSYVHAYVKGGVAAS